ncbi:MAG: DUF1553 domain-containing protein [Acidobacteria bacterium]|nr:DUF1553 domain-containing protein [Acidobacteriota bacterium]
MRLLIVLMAAVLSASEKNIVDEHIFGRMERDGIPHAAVSTDSEFIRRVYLDAIGQLPGPEAVRAFLGDTDPNKRDKLIDSLIGAEEFAEQWAWFWGDLFRTVGRSGDGMNGYLFHFWNKEWLRVNRPYNEVVYDLFTASAKSSSTIAAANLISRNSFDTNVLPINADDYRVSNRLDAIDDFSIESARIFLGINTTCISCHDGAGHLEPINQYLAGKTREEFFRQSAFIGKTRAITLWDDRGKNTTNGDQVVDDMSPGYTTGNDWPFMTESLNRMPRDGKTHEPAFILTGEKPRPGENPRAALARILTNHIQFSRATVNLIWSRLMTVGFVEPYDGFDPARLDKQATNPELLDALANEFKSHNYSVQHVIKTIMKSRAYQLSSRFSGAWKDAYAPYYARKYIRLLTGPEVIDAITKATDRPPSFTLDGLPMTRVKQLVWPNDVGRRDENGEIASIMQAFFQGSRLTQVPDGNRPTTLQALLMTNSSVVNKRVLAEKGSRVSRLLESGSSNAEIIEELFLATLARRPTPEETELALKAFESGRRLGAEDLQWVLLNSIEFVFNH